MIRKRQSVRNYLSIFVHAAALVSIGCGAQGPQLAPVQGRVLLDGQPLKTGQILTQPPAGRGANGAIQSDGSFQLSSGREPGALVGTHSVAVVAYDGDTSGAPEASQGKLLVPQRYTNADTSGLIMEVTPGENTPTIELTSAK
ncbi:MAG: hypothetical protein C0485_09425 [Pirellula sp.]|nr:hypothetical protein [Pirellula sp.]